MALSIKPYIENKERIHLIGIGGVSMNSLGELLLSRGVPISGSDRLAYGCYRTAGSSGRKDYLRAQAGERRGCVAHRAYRCRA